MLLLVVFWHCCRWVFCLFYFSVSMLLSFSWTGLGWHFLLILFGRLALAATSLDCSVLSGSGLVLVKSGFEVAPLKDRTKCRSSLKFLCSK